MATETIIEAFGNSKEDGEGNAILENFKRIKLLTKKEIRKWKRKNKIHETACTASDSICTRKNEMRWIGAENAFECTFKLSSWDNKAFFENLQGIRKNQEKNEFEKFRLDSVHLYLADDPDKYVRPSKTSIGIILRSVQIGECDSLGGLATVQFFGLKEVSPEPKNL